MYLPFFNLREPPFNLTPDPRFLFLSSQHEEALSHLLYGIHERKGFIEISGEVGTGKTVLCRALLEQLDDSVSTALIFNSLPDPSGTPGGPSAAISDWRWRALPAPP